MDCKGSPDADLVSLVTRYGLVLATLAEVLAKEPLERGCDFDPGG